MYTRSWNLDTIEPGDEITLTYAVAFAASTTPGLYKNVARVTGTTKNAIAGYGVPMVPFEVSKTVEFLGTGLVLGVSTSTESMVPSAPGLSRTSSCAPLITKDLKPGMSGDEVKKLQTFLNTQGIVVPTTGYYGSLTARAVSTFQEKYADEILIPNGLRRGTGTVGPATRAKINTLACGGNAPTSETAAPTTSATPTPNPSPTPTPTPPAAAKKPQTKSTKNSLGPLVTPNAGGVQYTAPTLPSNWALPKKLW